MVKRGRKITKNKTRTCVIVKNGSSPEPNFGKKTRHRTLRKENILNKCNKCSFVKISPLGKRTKSHLDMIAAPGSGAVREGSAQINPLKN